MYKIVHCVSKHLKLKKPSRFPPKLLWPPPALEAKHDSRFLDNILRDSWAGRGGTHLVFKISNSSLLKTGKYLLIDNENKSENSCVWKLHSGDQL